MLLFLIVFRSLKTELPRIWNIHSVTLNQPLNVCIFNQIRLDIYFKVIVKPTFVFSTEQTYLVIITASEIFLRSGLALPFPVGLHRMISCCRVLLLLLLLSLFHLQCVRRDPLLVEPELHFRLAVVIAETSRDRASY